MYRSCEVDHDHVTTATQDWTDMIHERYPLNGVDDALERLRATMNSLRLQVGKPHGAVSGQPVMKADEKSTINTKRTLLQRRSKLSESIEENPYDLCLYAALADTYLELRYLDLAVGSAYKALLLLDAYSDEADEYHDVARGALTDFVNGLDASDRVEMINRKGPTGLFQDDERDLRPANLPSGATDEEISSWLESYGTFIYSTLIHALVACGCWKTASIYADQALRRFGSNDVLLDLKRSTQHLAVPNGARVDNVNGQILEVSLSVLPDSGSVRREKYPWNTHEPDRLRELSTLNEMLSAVAPGLEVRVVELPTLASNAGEPATNLQLGLFAKEDIAPGEVVLDETTMLTANNKLQDALCDACSADLPALNDEAAESLAYCPECEVVFCSHECFERASSSYHPALCGMDVEAIAKDAPLAESADSLYALLLLRSLAMAQTQDCHPLDLEEIKYIWGDLDGAEVDGAEDTLLRALPFSFKYNVQLPFHMLEKMDVDIFTCPYADVWVFNTLYAKFRGTASARLSGLGGRAARGPEVSAVHPMWCLANHSCDPNVSWEWGGSIKFWVRDGRAKWKGKEESETRREPGIRKGEELLNHYCDIDLPVGERRAWASGALGGECMCPRCVWEAKQEGDISA